MRRHLLNLLTLLSLLLCVAVCVLWVRSYSRRHVLEWTLTNLNEPPDPTKRIPRCEDRWMIEFASGGVRFGRWRIKADVIFMGAYDGTPKSGFEYYTTRNAAYPLLGSSDVFPDRGLLWTLGGLQLFADSDGGYSEQKVTAPLWLFAILTSVLPAVRFFRWSRRRRSAAPGGFPLAQDRQSV